MKVLDTFESDADKSIDNGRWNEMSLDELIHQKTIFVDRIMYLLESGNVSMVYSLQAGLDELEYIIQDRYSKDTNTKIKTNTII